MEKLRLADGTELNLITNGIRKADKQIEAKILPEGKTLSEVNDLVSDEEKTQEIKLISEDGEELAIYTGYTELTSISQELKADIGTDDDGNIIQGKLVTLRMEKPDEVTKRISAVESQMTDMQLALCEVYELI